MVKITLMILLIVLLSSLQCSTWSKYARDTRINVVPNKLVEISDSLEIEINVYANFEIMNRVDSIDLRFHYLIGNKYPSNNGNEVGKLLLTDKVLNQNINVKTKFIDGNSLYVKSIVYKRNEKIDSPYLLIASQ